MNEVKKLLKGKKDPGYENNFGSNSEDSSSWPQNASDYELKTQIGQGAFAKVYQARCISKKVDVAIKVMELDNLTSSLDDIYQEVRVMLLSKNPSVLRAYACFVVKRSLWLVMPLMRKGSCLRIMKVLRRLGHGDGMKEDWIATVLKSALIGLEYFHAQGQLHRDIKASNLLMDSDGSVRLADFGVAGWLPNNSFERKEGERRTFVGTPCWMAPEVMAQERAYDEKADIWSFGITALELAKGYAPYARMQPMKVLLMTIQSPPPSLKSYDDYSKTKFSRHFKEIISLCLQKNPVHRPSASTLLQKTFFKRAPPCSSLVKELLDAVPIPDSHEVSSSKTDKEMQKVLDQVKKDQVEEVEKQELKKQLNQSARALDASYRSLPIPSSTPTPPICEASAAATADDEKLRSATPPLANAFTQNEESEIAQLTEEQLKLQEKAAKMDQAELQRNTTWVFDDDDDEDNTKQDNSTDTQVKKDSEIPIGLGVSDDNDKSQFDAFESVYNSMNIKGEDGK